jgi:hypothetical protein
MNDEFSAEDKEIDCYVHYHEYDFSKDRPSIVVRGLFGSHGYDVDVFTGELTRRCICEARYVNECVCGVY